MEEISNHLQNKSNQPCHNCFVALSCDAPESWQKLKGHQISEKFDTNEEGKWNLF